MQITSEKFFVDVSRINQTMRCSLLFLLNVELNNSSFRETMLVSFGIEVKFIEGNSKTKLQQQYGVWFGAAHHKRANYYPWKHGRDSLDSFKMKAFLSLRNEWVSFLCLFVFISELFRWSCVFSSIRWGWKFSINNK